MPYHECVRKEQKPHLILFDLEILPNMKEVLKVFSSLSNYPGQTMKASINSVICFGYKEFGSPKTNCVSAWDFKNWNKNKNDDYEIVKKAREILSDADAIITHNGKRFDLPFLQTRLALNGLPPLPNIKHIDTCLLARRHLKFFNNKLGTIGELLVGESKIKNDGWDLWVRVFNNDTKALKEMENYCKGDVNLLEKIFIKLRAYSSDIPNHNLFTKDSVCSNCGSLRMTKNGTKYTKTAKQQRWFCHDCGSTIYQPCGKIIRT